MDYGKNIVASNRLYQKSAKRLTTGKVSEWYDFLIFLNCVGALNKLLKQEKGDLVTGKGKGKGKKAGPSKEAKASLHR